MQSCSLLLIAWNTMTKTKYSVWYIFLYPSVIQVVSWFPSEIYWIST
jgi:hypothetical protein